MPGISLASWLNTSKINPEEGQYDLFFEDEEQRPGAASKGADPPARMAAADMTDDEICDCIGRITSGNAAEVLGEAARRRIARAVRPLGGVIRRFKGFESRRPFIEVTEALRALVEIGGEDALAVLRSSMDHGDFNRTTLGAALRAAQQLRLRLDPAVVEAALDHELAEVRLAACALVTARPSLIAALVERLKDEVEQVRTAAACALGELGRIEARPNLLDLLKTSPSEAVIQAAANVANDPIVVELGKLARHQPRFRQPVAEALEDCTLEVAAKIRRNLEGAAQALISRPPS